MAATSSAPFAFAVVALLLFAGSLLAAADDNNVATAADSTGSSSPSVSVCDGELPASLATNYSGLSCRVVWNNYALWYSQDSNNVLRVVLSTLYTEGWVGMGFSKDGLMVGSSAMVGWIGKTGLPHIKQFYLGGQTSSQVVVNEGQLTLTQTTPKVVVEQAKIYIAFQSSFVAPLTNQQIILAFGMSIPVNNRLTKHTDRTSFGFDFTTGTDYGSSYPSNLKSAHGALNIVAWGVLLPIGSIIARYGRNWDPLWFYLHVGFQFVGFFLGLAGIVVGVELYNKLHANVPAHRGLGIFIFVLTILQILAFFIRPDKDSKIRRYWNWYHHWVGRLTLFLAAINIVVGIHIGDSGVSWKAGYGFSLAVILITVIVLEVLYWTRGRGRPDVSIPPPPPPVFK